MIVALAPERKDEERPRQAASRAHREDEGTTVLLERRTITLDAIDTVETALDLTHRRRPRDERADQADQQRNEVVLGTDAASLFDRVGQQSTGGVGDGALNGGDDLTAHAHVTERGGEPDHRDQALDEHERRQECQRAGVAESIRSSQPDERVFQQLPASGVEERLASVVTGELPRLGNLCSGAHADSAGTHTSTAAGSISIASFFTSLRSPPSSS